MEEVKKNVQIESVTYITDSRVVLAQLRSDPCKFDTFTGPRINFIQDNSKMSTWMWCPGDQNPADLPTRNKTTISEMKSFLWLNGGFLMQPQEVWPTKCLAEDDILVSYQNPLLTAKLLMNKVSMREVTFLEKIMDKQTYLDSAINITAYCLKWNNNEKSFLELRDIAKRRIIEDTMIHSKILNQKMKFYNGEVIEEDGILYLHMRNFPGKPPNKLIIIDSKSSFGKLLIRHVHETSGHLTSVRSIQAKLQMLGYYLPNSTKCIMSYKSKCYLCKKLMIMPGCQRMGDVPAQRISQSKPFSSIYLDIAGPYRSFDSVKKRTEMKIWCLVVSCTYTRAVFCYTLENYAADSILNALERHKSRFGAFNTVFSDLGTNLKHAAKNLETADPKIQSTLESSERNVQWKYGVPKAPWYTGGAESMVKLMKNNLKVFRVKHGHKKLTPLEWETLFLRISNLINERPLCLSTEPGMVLCANDLLHGFSNNPLEHTVIPETNLTKRYSSIQDSLKIWWKIFHDNLLKSISNMEKWKSAEENLQTNDVVLLLDQPNKVGSYKLGKVIETYPDRRNLVRTVKVEYISPMGQKIQVERSTRTLMKLLNDLD